MDLVWIWLGFRLHYTQIWLGSRSNLIQKRWRIGTGGKERREREGEERAEIMWKEESEEKERENVMMLYDQGTNQCAVSAPRNACPGSIMSTGKRPMPFGSEASPLARQLFCSDHVVRNSARVLGGSLLGEEN